MKKIFVVLTFISIQSFGEAGLLKAPFTEVEYQLAQSASGRLVTPPMVAEDIYRDAILTDCRQFRETVNQFGAQIGTDEFTSIVLAPLPYSMKKNYEVELAFPVQKNLDLKKDGELLYHYSQEPPVLQWDEADLLKDVLNPADSLVLSDVSAAVFRLKITRRDIFCSFLDEKLKLNLRASVYWKLSEVNRSSIEKNLTLLVDKLTPVLDTDNGKMLLAALTGRAIYQVSLHPAFQAHKKFSSVEYIWTLLFESEDSLKKSGLWSAINNDTYLQKKPAVLTLRGVQ